MSTLVVQLALASLPIGPRRPLIDPVKLTDMHFITTAYTSFLKTLSMPLSRYPIPPIATLWRDIPGNRFAGNPVQLTLLVADHQLLIISPSHRFHLFRLAPRQGQAIGRTR